MSTEPQAFAAATNPSSNSGEQVASNRRSGAFGLREVALLGLIAVLAWRVVVVNMADYFAQEGTPEGTRQALSWSAKQPQALTDLALAQVKPNSPERLASLRAAALANPVDGRLYAALAFEAEAAGKDPDLAAKAMDTAIRLTPQRTDVRLDAYQFWLRQNDLTRALAAASVALTRDFELAEQLFPQFLHLMAHPQSDAAFAALLKAPIKWWPNFFQFVAARAPNVNVLRALYGLQSKGPNRIDETQLRAYLGRMQRDGQWLDAYFTWLDSLPREGIAFTGEVHNGGFEEPTRNLGFEWIDEPATGVLVGFDPTYGTTGGRALHVVFQGARTQWRNFHQYLMLAPGEYSLRGRVRVDSLEAERGVQWRLACLGASDPLATSERFKGTDQWHHFSVSLTVPANGCSVQDLRLELVGKAQLDFVADGQIWFDDMAIVRK